MHTTANCPLRSMAWITLDDHNRVIEATKEMKELLGYNPVNQTIDSLWKYEKNDGAYLIVNTIYNSRTLCICLHTQKEGRVLVCLDITDLKNYQTNTNVSCSIFRLSMYGTIEAVISNEEYGTSWIGQPMMRYIHSDDVEKFCMATSQATRSPSFLVQLTLRFLPSPEQQASFECTFLSVDQQQLICFIQPTSTYIQHIVTQTQRKFWQTFEYGMTTVAHHLSQSLLLLAKIMRGCHKKDEVEFLCTVASYIGISPSTTKGWLNQFVDQTFEWFVHDSDFIV
ncbi:hypothetical protein BCV72DRAFT_231367 [Rhizopus microsporus var. microsporus]|uniref:Uncharacterized protein n=2 Tax=Rhizopus microsporus TaxID=58291 RepID=A0A2G4SSS8_RHIZD|nr:uncharacterized protein RHIMIDRAFT_256445 [Rhizopus microsporus ATCC 52813]ORE04498.1 hypothetical protein BCV72DRAFT_231367 [Rhizopus microsporus var. microsporus]PHZ11848.1 hypothetical protein RHIMIDRAFT_256445 [Rhizopus microsporus ATCC 52813]